ncbi:MAG: flagellar basal body rod C-terminal domain-containing protein, partial [Planctomycetota bacterium]
AQLVAINDRTPLPITSGSIGGLLDSRDGSIDAVIDRLDTLARELIFGVNQLHAVSQDATGLTEASAEVQIASGDLIKAFNDTTNLSMKGLPAAPTSGTFTVHVWNPGSGAVEERLIEVDLNGFDASGAKTTASDTTPQQLADALNGIPGLNASFDANGKLGITSDAGFEFSFEDDTSGVLGAMGVNAYFTGTSAANISVRQDLQESPTKLRLGRRENGQVIENATAKAIANLQDKTIGTLGGVSLREYWSEGVQQVANDANSAQTRTESAALVRESLQAQRDAVSGVSIDEESINLLTFQRQYQGSARVISVADELLNTLIALI